MLSSRPVLHIWHMYRTPSQLLNMVFFSLPFPLPTYFLVVSPIWYFCSESSLNICIITLPSPVCCLWLSWGTQHTSQKILHSWKWSRHSLLIHLFLFKVIFLPVFCQKSVHPFHTCRGRYIFCHPCRHIIFLLFLQGITRNMFIFSNWELLAIF